jgi:chromate reductase
VKILAISGSLRAASINSALLRTVKRLAPPEIEITLCTVIGELPLFNPDLEQRLPAPVALLHGQVSSADALLIASPEYAHGVTGTIKNALDWLVSFEPFVDKPVAVLNASPRAHHADLALRETLKTMSAAIVESACISFPLLGSGITEQGMVQQAWIAQGIRESLAALYNVVRLRQPEQGPSFPIGPQ